MDLQLRGKKALICAASSGLGFATAAALAAEGVELVVCARRAEPLIAAAENLQSLHGVRVLPITADLAAADDVTRLCKQVRRDFGDIDILVNNTGGPPPSAAHATEDTAWQTGFNQLFMSATRLTREFLPAMRQQRFGRIITITSLSAIEPIEHLAVSNAMRAAVSAFAKTLSREVAAEQITVNTVMPGVIHTPRIDDLRHKAAARNGTTYEQEMQSTAASIPGRRLGKPQELADLICFLASPRASYITGQNIAVDGGLSRGWA